MIKSKQNTFSKTKKTIQSLRRDKKRGFTLVEMIVAVGLFAIVMMIVVSVVLSIISGNRKAQAINSVVNNLNFAIESMVRDMKTGYDYRCDTSVSMDPGDFGPNNRCDSTDFVDSVQFISVLGTGGSPMPVRYAFYEDATAGMGRIEKTSSVGGSLFSSYITSPDINIKSLKFFVKNPPPNPGNHAEAGQPGILVLISGTAKIGLEESDFNIQTFVSQRNLNL
jgi:prepilin-type N-terminal cleavage/methylation domain-containing protein